jgi:hypothetical protein
MYQSTKITSRSCRAQKAKEVDPVVKIPVMYGKEFAGKLGFPALAISAIKPSVPPTIQPSKGRHASP